MSKVHLVDYPHQDEPVVLVRAQMRAECGLHRPRLYSPHVREVTCRSCLARHKKRSGRRGITQ